MTHYPLKIGLFGVGLNTYWPQFEGLQPRLQNHVRMVADKLQRPGVEVVNLGLVDDIDKAFTTSHSLRRADVDLVFLYATTYAVSSTVLAAVARVKVPVIVLNLQPEAAIDYQRLNSMGDRTRMTGEWLAYCASCTVPEIANVFRRARIPFHQVTGVLHGDPHVWQEIEGWVDAALVAHTMAHNRLGVMGRYYNGMLDIYTDMTLQCATFGGHMDILEMDELADLCQSASSTHIADKLHQFANEFDIQSDCHSHDLTLAARTAVGLDQLIEKHQLGAMAYFYQSVPGHEHEAIISSIILGASGLTSRGIPIAGEYEIKNAQAMKIMHGLGAGGSFTEYYAVDFQDDVVLMGHDGPGHSGIAQGKTKVRPLKVFHGKVGAGVSVEMSVKHGPVTLLSVTEHSGGTLKLLCAHAESVAGPILEIGNTNSRYRFSIGARQFIEQWNSHGPAHHCAIGVGHVADRLHKLAALLGIDCVQVC